jgi:ankyrin repeat protein
VLALDAQRREAPPRTYDLVDIILFGSVHELRARLDSGEPTTKLAMLAGAARDPDRLDLLLARGGPATARTAGGVGLLAIAAHHSGGAANVRLLLGRGAEVDARDEQDMTALTRAIQAGDLASARALLDAGATVAFRDKTGSTLIAWVESVGDLPKLELLHQRGAKVAGKTFDDYPALTLSVIDRDVAFTRELLARGALVDERDAAGLTPLHWAATVDAGTNELAKLLLAAGADRQAKSTAGDTPLALARRHHNRAVEQLLLE